MTARVNGDGARAPPGGRGPRQGLPGPPVSGVPRPQGGRPGGVRRLVLDRRRPDARPRGGEWVGQVHGRPLRAAAARAERRVGEVRRRRARRDEPSRAAAAAAGDADGLPGPLCLARPAPDGRGGDQRAAADPQGQARPPGPGRRPAGTGRAGARPRQALPARVLRWPAPAHRHRQGARPRAEVDRPRRAGVRPRRVDPGRRDEPAAGPPASAPPLVPVHRPRPVGGPAHLRDRRRDVPRPDHGDRAGGDAVHRCRPPVHAGVALGGARAGPRDRAQPRADRALRRHPQPHRPAVGVPVPHPVPEGPGALRRRGAGARSTAASGTRWPATTRSGSPPAWRRSTSRNGR